MSSNLTSPRARWHATNPMSAYDRLPPDLRTWLAGAALPWSAASVLRIWQRALKETGCTKAARDRLACGARPSGKARRRMKFELPAGVKYPKCSSPKP